MSVRRLRPASSTKGHKDDDTKTCPIVGIGASAGGLEAATVLLNHLPIDTGFGFVLVQHLDPQHESALTHLLARATSLPVTEIEHNLPVEPNHVYVIPPNASLRIQRGVLTLQPRPATRMPHHPIDFFLESLAEDCQDRAIGVILSGTATDGTLGLEAIKGQGGITFAQDGSARYDSMPRSAVASGSVDFVLSPEAIAKELTRIARHPCVSAPAVFPDSQHEELKPGTRTGRARTASSARHASGDEAVGEKPKGDGFRDILVLLRNHSGVDFSLYKSTTIQRRITRRMVVNKMNTPEGYVAFLRRDGKELEALYSDMLISVTGFFRNPQAFDILKRKVFPKLLQQRGDNPIRVWVLGCSTGQEAYSMAMVFAEASDKAPRPRKLQVFATDLNDALLDKARHGLYARNLTQEVTPERLRRFFVEEEGGYRVSKPLREMVVFARQNLINDPPFSRMDLISCRNLMIYLEPSLQRKAIPAFHYALKPEGFLFLGASESVGGFTDLFEPFDQTHRIYSRKAAPPRLFQLPIKGNPEGVQQAAATPVPKARALASGSAEHQILESFRGEISPEREADRVSVSRFAPSGVLINADLQVLQFRGTTATYLQHPTGKASLDILKMAREGLMLPLRATINKAKSADRIARREGIQLRQGKKTRLTNVEVIPLRNLKERCFLVLFEETGARKLPGKVSPELTGTHGKTASPDKEAARRIAELESELKETREYLQSIHQRQAAANEELQASSEEVQSANEELQSVNEELETSKEELESANEELTTINEEMSTRNLELSRLNSDLVNIQTSGRLPIVLLGRDLTIRRFSAQAERQFNLLAADVGRPFSHVRHNLVLDAQQRPDADIESFIADVIASVREREREVRDTEGRWYSLRVRPYLTVDNKVDGAVLVLVDINDLKRTEQAIANARDYSEAIIRTVRDPLLILTADLRVHMANDAFYKTFHVRPEESSGRMIFELGNRQWDIPKLRQLLEEILPRKSFFDDLEVTHDFESIGRRTMLLNARQLTLPGQSERILLGIQDVTETLVFQANAREDAEKFKVLFERSPLPKWTLDPLTLRFLNVNNAAVELYGYSHEEFLQMTLLDVLTRETRDSIQTALAQPPHRLPESATGRHQKKNGEVIDVDVRVNEISIAGRLAWLASNNDITELQRAEQALKALNETLTTELASTRQLQETSTQLIVEDVPDSLFQQALNAAITIMHSDMASIQMVDEEQDALRLLASHGFEPDFDQTFRWVRRDTQTSSIVAWHERHRVIVPDIETWEYLVDDQALDAHRKVGIRAVQSTPLISRDGRIIGVISTHWRDPYQPEGSSLRLMDILARQAADLIDRNNTEEALREADRRKTEFIAVLAHELRNPLSPIRSALEIIRHTKSTAMDVQAATAMMERQIGQVVRLVDDLLDMSRISRGKVELRKGRIDLTLVMNQAVEAIQTHVKSKELQFALTLPPEPIYLNADSVRLVQVVVNLLNNACKFTDRGGSIWLTAEVEGRSDHVLIKVRDTGIGIDPIQIHRIFEMFTQVETAMQRTQGGLGIGLALTKKLVELHGGELRAQSEGPGKGSEFVVRLPMLTEAACPTAEPLGNQTTVAIPRRVLVVDDNMDSVESLSLLLRMTGTETYTAHDGLEAIDAAATFRPDVVLMDIGLPNLNGYDAARRIREQPWGKQMMLVALTGWGQDEDRQRSRDAGFDSHLVKPVDYATLTKLLNHHNGG